MLQDATGTCWFKVIQGFSKKLEAEGKLTKAVQRVDSESKERETQSEREIDK